MADTLDGHKIDVSKQRYRLLSQLVRYVPGRGDDKPLSPATLIRWSRVGRRGVSGELVRLRLTRVGGVWCGTLEDLNAFISALNVASTDLAQVRSPSERQRSEEEAKKLLDAAGVTP